MPHKWLTIQQLNHSFQLHRLQGFGDGFQIIADQSRYPVNQPDYNVAMASISTEAALGSADTATQALAGGLEEKNSL